MKMKLSKDLTYHVAGFLFEVVTEEKCNGGVMNCLTTSMVVEHCHFRSADTMKTAENDAKQLELCNKLLHFTADLDADVARASGSSPGTGAIGIIPSTRALVAQRQAQRRVERSGPVAADPIPAAAMPKRLLMLHGRSAKQLQFSLTNPRLRRTAAAVAVACNLPRAHATKYTGGTMEKEMLGSFVADFMITMLFLMLGHVIFNMVTEFRAPTANYFILQLRYTVAKVIAMIGQIALCLSYVIVPHPGDSFVDIGTNENTYLQSSGVGTVSRENDPDTLCVMDIPATPVAPLLCTVCMR